MTANPANVSLDGLAPEFRQRLTGLLDEAGDRLKLNYGWRARAVQQRLYDLFIAGHGAAANRPGTSKHEVGEAADVDDLGKNAELRACLAKKYGFIQPYPKEPWHLELDPHRTPLPAPPTSQAQVEQEDDMSTALTVTWNNGTKMIGTPDGALKAAGAPSYGSFFSLRAEEKQVLSSPLTGFYALTAVDIDNPAAGVIAWVIGTDQQVHTFKFDQGFADSHK